MIDKLKNYKIGIKKKEVIKMLKNGVSIDQIKEDYNVD